MFSGQAQRPAQGDELGVVHRLLPSSIAFILAGAELVRGCAAGRGRIGLRRCRQFAL
ncbi:hypothetical protein [Streptomyces sp. NPDC047841]|uniref:hypothetical protein n=1 Tax=Streptomyces sp. NPDC047841 TaxID=3154708 RepID=UPI00345133EA